ncbi:hypothetical protein LOK49_LG10G01499 [Camellia lanceoleosa]|uniref:Uncharacterized protein n=1 Tax=Camellia lanceoleosa TaxID=1840588 RepID=A0ACC0GF01_9ERIC|nr:hypothetical protein LOK49_LG10G01499 [Camellia lanceoleosa]
MESLCSVEASLVAANVLLLMGLTRYKGFKEGHKRILVATDLVGRGIDIERVNIVDGYLPGPDDMLVLDIAYMIYLKFVEYPSALQIALFLDNMQYVKQVLMSCDDLLRKKQFCYILAQYGITFELDEEIAADDYEREALQEIINNTKLSEGYLTLARDIEVMEPKSPEDIYKVIVMDTLSRLSHDTDTKVAMAAVISLGLIGAGTNNARIAGMLRNLSSYYYKQASLLFCVRIAQGLVHLGKGLLTLAPYHSERFLLSLVNHSVELKEYMICIICKTGRIVTLLHACLDMKAIILGKYHYVLYFLVLAMQPRMLLTVDENLNLCQYLCGWAKLSMLLARQVDPRPLLVSRPTQHRFFWLLVLQVGACY